MLRSIYAKILLWVLCTLGLALAAFIAISNEFSSRGPHDMFARDVQFQFDEARDAYLTSASAGLAKYLRSLEAHFPGHHLFCSGDGSNLADGSDCSGLVREAKMRQGGRPRSASTLAFAKSSADGKYWYLVTANARLTPWNFLLFFVPVVGVVVILSWLLAANIGVPLRALSRTVERFGSGDLGARARLTRRDEIGEMARTFDQMAERIETLLNAERRLLRDISHELRSPLARLSFAAELALTAENRDAAVARLKKEIARLASLVGSLIEMTRAEGDPGGQVLAPVDVAELLREIEGDCRVEAEAKCCSIAMKVFPAVVHGDRELLRRAFENILRNAIRYAPVESVVDVEMRRQDERLMISFRDFGPGVPAGSLTKIFEPFFRVDNSRDSTTGGVGLGLAITQRAILLHRGRVLASNMEPGLRVDVEIPA